MIASTPHGSSTARSTATPDLNPIEQAFAKLKHMLRKAGARTIDGLYDEIRQLLGAFPPEECANYFKNAGYALT
jgi:transposase